MMIRSPKYVITGMHLHRDIRTYIYIQIDTCRLYVCTIQAIIDEVVCASRSRRLANTPAFVKRGKSFCDRLIDSFSFFLSLLCKREGKEVSRLAACLCETFIAAGSRLSILRLVKRKEEQPLLPSLLYIRLFRAMMMMMLGTPRLDRSVDACMHASIDTCVGQ